jgi:hypothetical protein
MINSSNYPFEDVDLSRLFINTLEIHKDWTSNNIHGNYHTDYHKDDIIEIPYKVNSLKYRSKEFKKNEDMLILGCSHTAGDGLFFDDVWSTVLAKKLNLEFSSLADGGDSSIGQIIKAFYYFEKFGNPKMIVALFPINRMPTVYSENNLEIGNKDINNIMKNNKKSDLIQKADINYLTARFSKAPHNIEDIVGRDFSFFYEKVFIDILRQYCKSNKINLVWSVWDPAYQAYVYKEINRFYPEHHREYCHIEAFDWQEKDGQNDNYGEFNSLSCHQEKREDILFYKAADRIGRKPHWGTHKHMHIADDFYKHIKENILIK